MARRLTILVPAAPAEPPEGGAEVWENAAVASGRGLDVRPGERARVRGEGWAAWTVAAVDCGVLLRRGHAPLQPGVWGEEDRYLPRAWVEVLREPEDTGEDEV